MSGADHATCSGCGCGIDRRTFLSQTTIAAVTALLAEACGTGVWEPLAPPSLVIPSTGLSFSLGNYPALAQVGGIAVVPIASHVPVALVRTGASSFVLLSLICPHQGTTVNVSSSGFVCPNHGARFAADGTWTGGQATANLTSYAVTYIAASGTLTVAAPPAPPPPAIPANNGTQLVVTLANVSALTAVGGIARVDGNTSNPVALVHAAQSTYVALSMICPHQGATISVQSGGFICPRHGARFSATGAWTGGQRTSSLRELASVYDATKGTVTITL
jgi:Rieske Fe-S protein